jgi:hypothetical protein
MAFMSCGDHLVSKRRRTLAGAANHFNVYRPSDMSCRLETSQTRRDDGLLMAFAMLNVEDIRDDMLNFRHILLVVLQMLEAAKPRSDRCAA